MVLILLFFDKLIAYILRDSVRAELNVLCCDTIDNKSNRIHSKHFFERAISVRVLLDIFNTNGLTIGLFVDFVADLFDDIRALSQAIKHARQNVSYRFSSPKPINNIRMWTVAQDWSNTYSIDNVSSTTSDSGNSKGFDLWASHNISSTELPSENVSFFLRATARSAIAQSFLWTRCRNLDSL